MSKKTILIAEDETIISLDLKNILRQNNFDIFAVVSTGDDLIEKCKTKKPDLIITDYNLKGTINGITAVSKISSDSNIPVIIISGSPESQLKELTNNKILFNYLLKPIDTIKLLYLINNILQVPKAAPAKNPLT
jgi:DNA-binding NtrC family response regulator